MRRLFWILLVFILSVWIGLKIAKDPGYAIFGYQNWTVEMPLWFALLSFLIVILLLYLILRFFDSIDFSLYRLKNWRASRKKYKAYSKTNRGLIELIEGQWRNAELELSEGVSQSAAPLINYLAAAKAAHEQKAYDRRDTYLRKAHQLAPQADIAIGLTQAQLQFEQGQLEQAAATLEHLQRLAPKHPFVLKLLEKVYVRLSDWNGLIRILPSLKKAKLLTDEQLILFEENTYKEILRAAATKSLSLDSIQQAWKSIPSAMQKKPNIVYTYCKLSMPYSEASVEIEQIINKVIKKQWDTRLVYLYGILKTPDSKQQLAYAEAWLRQYGHQAVLLLTLGRLCARCHLWGKARSYFEDSLKLEANPETYMEYGKLLAELGELSQAAQNYRTGLELSEKENVEI